MDNLELAETGDGPSGRVPGSNAPANDGLQSEKQLHEYAALLGLRYDGELDKFSVK